MIRHIEFANLHNFRDVGGYAAGNDRTVRWQRLYRADSLGWLDGDDVTRFHALGVRTVIDLRHAFEISKAGRVPETEGLSYRHLPIEGRPWDLDKQFDPAKGVGRFLADRYLEVSEDGVANLRQAIEAIAEEPNAPLVVHCAAGKDRTGILVALVLTLLGVSEEDIVADYALTGLATPRFIADGRRKHPDAPLWVGFGAAPADAMSCFLTDLAARHGSASAYCTEVLGVDQPTIANLRRNLTEG
ncbi:MAG: tyrosine-protein phosphatase [Nonomuraea sp.]|nr:tyrosine-protein phosphatase [Nonomuraea sp.]